MSRIQDLKVFVSERLRAAASEIFGAVEKTITDYEEKCARLKEENDRNRSLLDIILKTKSHKEGGFCGGASRAVSRRRLRRLTLSALLLKRRYDAANDVS